MKTWKICVEDGPHQSFYVEVKAQTLKSAINKVKRDIAKNKPWLNILICPSACKEIIDIEEIEK